MEPLITNRRYLVWLCVCPANKSASRWQKLAHATFATIVLTAVMCGVTGCLTFCWKFASIDFGRSVFAFMFAVAEFTAVYTATVGIFLLRHKIGAIFDNLAVIYRQSKCFFYLENIFKNQKNTTFVSNPDQKTDSFDYLARANDTSEWMCKTFSKIATVAIIVNISLVPIISVLFCWATNKDAGVENYYHPIPYVWVRNFNWKIAVEFYEFMWFFIFL